VLAGAVDTFEDDEFSARGHECWSEFSTGRESAGARQKAANLEWIEHVGR
jgi:hypothetical protein